MGLSFLGFRTKMVTSYGATSSGWLSVTIDLLFQQPLYLAMDMKFRIVIQNSVIAIKNW